MKPALEIQSMPYPDSLLVSWRSGYYSFLLSSGASDYIKSVLVAKSRIRPGIRFFGEAFVASKIAMIDGWYSSYKWLTSKKWIEGTGLETQFQKAFYHALHKYIEAETLTKVQMKARILSQDFGDSNLKPVAPDLWLIDKQGSFQFIEVKLPGDTISKNQLAGLALIKKYIRAKNGVSVKLISLYPENSTPPDEMDSQSEFMEFYRLA